MSTSSHSSNIDCMFFILFEDRNHIRFVHGCDSNNFRSPVYCIGSRLGVRLPLAPESHEGIRSSTSFRTLSYIRCCSAISCLYLVDFFRLVNAFVLRFFPCGLSNTRT